MYIQIDTYICINIHVYMSMCIVAAVLSSLASQPGDTLLSAVNKGSRTKKEASISSSVGQEGAERSVREYRESASEYETVIEVRVKMLHVKQHSWN
jgi:hypothetical protein